MSLYTVWRHGGNQTHKWRGVTSGTLKMCTDKFLALEVPLRQGGLIVLPMGKNPNELGVYPLMFGFVLREVEALIPRVDGRVLYSTAPLLRTRW